MTFERILKFVEDNRGPEKHRGQADEGGQNARTRPGGVFDGGLNHPRALQPNECFDLLKELGIGDLTPKHQSGDGNADHQQGRQGKERIESQCRT